MRFVFSLSSPPGAHRSAKRGGVAEKTLHKPQSHADFCKSPDRAREVAFLSVKTHFHLTGRRRAASTPPLNDGSATAFMALFLERARSVVRFIRAPQKPRSRRFSRPRTAPRHALAAPPGPAPVRGRRRGPASRRYSTGAGEPSLAALTPGGRPLPPPRQWSVPPPTTLSPPDRRRQSRLATAPPVRSGTRTY